MREKIRQILERPIVGRVIMGVIMFNAVLLGLETVDSVMAVAGPLILLLDQLCLAIFIIEITARLIVYRGAFFRDGWNIFDFLVVAVALAPAGEGFAVLRALRILRVLRVISVVPALKRVVEGLLNALPGMASVFLLMAMIFYVASVMATKLFGDAFPDWFGSLGRSAYSLFQIMTLESWSMGIVRPVMEVFPYAGTFFVPFILVTTFAVVNLVVGLVVNSMQDAHAEEQNAATDAYRDEVLQRLKAIETELSKRD